MKRLAIAGLVATSVGVALPVTAATQDMEPPQTGFVRGPDSYTWRMEELSQYRAYIQHMSPENRMKLMGMQDKMMQMEMDHKSTMMKMDMEMAKARRDIEMFILSAGSEGH
jgi:hypothetical protein